MSRTGTQFVTAALREIQVLDPTATASGEQLQDGLDAATDLLDSWALDLLTIGGVTISTYALTSGTAAYTIGSGGAFDQEYPSDIERWSVIPDNTATYLTELSRGRPVNADVWSRITVKTLPGGYPSAMYFDHASSAGLGTCSFSPVPNTTHISVRLYTKIPAITSLVAGTTYTLRRGATRALTLNLAVELVDRYGKAATMTPRLEQRAADALALLKRSNIIPKASAVRPEFIIGSAVGRRTHNVYTDS